MTHYHCKHEHLGAVLSFVCHAVHVIDIPLTDLLYILVKCLAKPPVIESYVEVDYAHALNCYRTNGYCRNRHFELLATRQGITCHVRSLKLVEICGYALRNSMN